MVTLVLTTDYGDLVLTTDYGDIVLTTGRTIVSPSSQF